MKLLTSDNKQIAFVYYEAENPKRWIIFLHMMPAVKESWGDLAKKFQQAGYASIAIDLRGHGESEGGPDGYKNFSDSDHQNSVYDIDAAVEFLKQKGAVAEKTSFIGASIGANLSLQYIAEHTEFKAAVLLSPGFNYRGVQTEPTVKRLKPDHRVFFVSSQDDVRSSGNNAEQNRGLFEIVPAGIEKKLQIYKSGGHGTDLLENIPELSGLILEFVSRS